MKKNNLIINPKIESALEHSWLGLGDINALQINNGFVGWSKEDLENPMKAILRFMREPRNFGLTCKLLFNITLLPFQVATLWEIWNHVFPMIVCARGFSKSYLLALYIMLKLFFSQGIKIAVTGAAFRQSKVVFEYCETIWNNAPIFRDLVGGSVRCGPRRDIDRCTMIIGESIAFFLPIGDGCLSPLTPITYDDSFGYIVDDVNSTTEAIIHRNRGIWSSGNFRNSDEAYCNGNKPTLKVITEMGLELEGTYNHRIKILRNSILEWARLDELRVGDRVPIDRTFRWHNGNSNITEAQAYALGLMIGDGSWVQKCLLQFTNLSEELVQAVEKGTGFEFKKADYCHYIHYGVKDKQAWLDFWGMGICYTIDKVLPKKILSANRQVMSACLRGLFDTDGHIFISAAKGGIAGSIGFTNTSKELVKQMQFILLHYGIVSHLGYRDRNDNWNTSYELLITGEEVLKFYKHIGFGCIEKQDKLVKLVKNKKRWRNLVDEIPGIRDDVLGLIEKYGRKPGIRYYINNGPKTITCRAGQLILERYRDYKDEFLDRLKIITNKNIYYDKIQTIEKSSCVTYDIHVPEGHEYCAGGFYSHNSKIRGQRANIIIAEEFSVIPKEVFETVIAGFGVVSMNPVEQVQKIARNKVLIAHNMKMRDDSFYECNQTIISGTAYYDFNHFADYWRRWKTIIETNGDNKKLCEVLGKTEIDPAFKHSDYCIIRISVDMLPEGFMDAKQIARTKATVHTGIYEMEMGAIFAKDSNGFFNAKLIQSCVVGQKEPIVLPEVGEINFTAMVRGNSGEEYIFAIDPASEKDKFSIVVLEYHKTHRRIVYCWTTTRKDYLQKLKLGLTNQQSFYGYCARKVRELMRYFPCKHIAMDSQGGGREISEALHDKDKMEGNELPIWEIIDTEKVKDSDGYPGLHILELINFAKADYTSKANHGMKKDFEDKVLLFPYFDTLSIQLASEEDYRNERIKLIDGHEVSLYDTLEDVVMEIEELKVELTTITHTQTAAIGRDHWDTPEIKQAGNKKGRLRKDRYSALLMANMAARTYQRAPVEPVYDWVGAVAQSKKEASQKNVVGNLYNLGPEWFVGKTRSIQPTQDYGTVVRRGK